jgi:hypothetical protein
MTRTFQDQDLQLWEAYASSGEFGSADRAHLIFQCLTDPGRRARMVDLEASRSAIEQKIVDAEPQRLSELLGQAVEVR